MKSNSQWLCARLLRTVRCPSSEDWKPTPTDHFHQFFRYHFRRLAELSCRQSSDVSPYDKAITDRPVNPCEAGAAPPVDARCVTDLLGSLPPHTNKPAFRMFQWIRNRSRLLSDTFFAKNADRILVEGDLAPVPSMEAQA